MLSRPNVPELRIDEIESLRAARVRAFDLVIDLAIISRRFLARIIEQNSS